MVSSNGVNGLSNGNAARDAFANYGYGPQASIAQSGYNNSPPSNGLAGNPLYTTPSLTINTATGATGMSSQMSPNTAGPFTPQTTQTPASANGAYAGFGGYNMLTMGIPGMSVLNGFPYANQMNAFTQVRGPKPTMRVCVLILAGHVTAASAITHYPATAGCISLLACRDVRCDVR